MTNNLGIAAMGAGRPNLRDRRAASGLVWIFVVGCDIMKACMVTDTAGGL